MANEPKQSAERSYAELIENGMRAQALREGARTQHPSDQQRTLDQHVAGHDDDHCVVVHDAGDDVLSSSASASASGPPPAAHPLGESSSETQPARDAVVVDIDAEVDAVLPIDDIPERDWASWSQMASRYMLAARNFSSSVTRINSMRKARADTVAKNVGLVKKEHFTVMDTMETMNTNDVILATREEWATKRIEQQQRTLRGVTAQIAPELIALDKLCQQATAHVANFSDMISNAEVPHKTFRSLYRQRQEIRNTRAKIRGRVAQLQEKDRRQKSEQAATATWDEKLEYARTLVQKLVLDDKRPPDEAWQECLRADPAPDPIALGAAFHEHDLVISADKMDVQCHKTEDAPSTSTHKTGGATSNPIATPCADDQDDNKLCVICIDAPRTMAFVPCGHRVVCIDCVDTLRKNAGTRGSMKCSVCRAGATTIMRVFD